MINIHFYVNFNHLFEKLFQVYKYLLAIRLIENSKLSLASQYLEAIALDVVHRPARQNRPLALLVAELADQIKMADPALAMISDPNDDPDWLNTLKQILDDTNVSFTENYFITVILYIIVFILFKKFINP